MKVILLKDIKGTGKNAYIEVVDKQNVSDFVKTRFHIKARWRKTSDRKFYDQIADSGDTVSSGFCPNCGSPMLKKTTKMPEIYFFHAGTMDDPSGFKPQIVVYEDSKQPWDHVDPKIPRN